MWIIQPLLKLCNSTALDNMQMWLCSNKTLFTKTDSGTDLAHRPLLAGPCQNINFKNVENVICFVNNLQEANIAHGLRYMPNEYLLNEQTNLIHTTSIGVKYYHFTKEYTMMK